MCISSTYIYTYSVSFTHLWSCTEYLISTVSRDDECLCTCRWSYKSRAAEREWRWQRLGRSQSASGKMLLKNVCVSSWKWPKLLVREWYMNSYVPLCTLNKEIILVKINVVRILISATFIISKMQKTIIHVISTMFYKYNEYKV